MERDRKNDTQFTNYIDSSIIANFAPGFFQKGLAHVREHPDEEFTMQVTESRVFLRRMKKSIFGKRPKDPVNGKIISWARLDCQQGN